MCRRTAARSPPCWPTAACKFMHIGCNWPSGCVKTPGLFWWEGPDGSRVLTFYSNTYGTCVPPLAAALVLRPGSLHQPQPRAAGRLAVQGLARHHRDAGQLRPAQGRAGQGAVRRRRRRNCPASKSAWARWMISWTPSSRRSPDIPVVKGEMPDTWIHGIMCDPGGIKLSREVHPQIAAAEALHTQLNLWGVAQPPIAKDVALAYEKILLYGEHTWGGAAAVQPIRRGLPEARSQDVRRPRSLLGGQDRLHPRSLAHLRPHHRRATCKRSPAP